MKCSIERCDREAEVKGLCRVCYSNERQKAKRLAERPVLKCDYCGEEYIPERYHAELGRNRFCSRKCKQDSHNRSPQQRATMRRLYYKRRYDMTPEQAIEMRLAGCAICGRMEAPGGRWENNLHIDHDHETGKVRGVLCHGCNLALGHLQHDPELLRKAIAYLG